MPVYPFNEEESPLGRSIERVLRTRTFDQETALLDDFRSAEYIKAGLQGFSPMTDSTRTRLENRELNYRNAFDSIFVKDNQLSGTLDVAGFNASKLFDLERSNTRNEQAERFSRDSDLYNIEMMRQSQASETYINRLAQVNQRLADVKNSMAGSASKASSKRQFQALSQQAMQGTNRYLAELERFKAPTSTEIDFRFTDPISGNKLDIDTNFEDVYSRGMNAQDAADLTVRNRFNEISTARSNEALEFLRTEFGNPEDYLNGTTEEEFLGRVERAKRLDTGVVLGKDPVNENTRTLMQLETQYLAAKGAQNFATEYGEAAALAEIGGYTEELKTQSRFGELDFDPISLFYGRDTNAILRDYTDKTAQRFEIAGISDENQMRQEFQRRKDLAIQERTLFDSQLQRNQQQAERIEAEKQSTRMLMEAQKREYAETLSSFDASTSSRNQGITFTDIRPQ